MTKLIKMALVVISTIALNGCVTVTTVKDITTDKVGYLSKNFTAQSINADVTKSLPKDSMPSINFRELNVSYSVEANLPDGRKNISSATAKYTPMENGMVQRVWEYSRNDIPSFLFFHVSYKGFLNLKWQAVPLESSIANPIFEIKKITRFDPIPAHANEQFTVDFETGLKQQLGGFNLGRFICRTTGVSHANTIDVKLQGEAIEFDCDSYSKNTMDGRVKWVLLKEYGAAIMLENTTTSSKTAYKIVTVTIN